jgi:hypothetical protein
MTTRVIPTKVHAIVDVVTGPTLVAAPNVGRFRDSTGSALPARAVGGGATVLSALTDYELGLVRVVPMRVHLALDALNGALLAAMPWLSRSAKRGKRYWLPHAIVGVSEIALALTTKTQPRQAPRARSLLRAIRRA